MFPVKMMVSCMKLRNESGVTADFIQECAENSIVLYEQYDL